MLITLGHTLRGGPLFKSFIECKSISFIDYWWLYMTMKKPMTSIPVYLNVLGKVVCIFEPHFHLMKEL